MMLKEIILVAVLLCHLTNAKSQGCYSNCEDLSYFDCRICYDSCPSGSQSGQYDFTLKQCTQTYCSQNATYIVYTGNSFDTRTYCTQYKQRNLSESDCVKACCDKPSYTTFTNQTYSQCTNTNILYQKVTNIGMIIGCSIGGVALLVMLGLACGCKERIKQCLQPYCECLRDDPEQNQNPQQSQTGINKEGNISSSIIFSKLVWTDTDQKQLAIFQETCSICLNRNINCQTSCGHKFHFDCFKLWTGKNPSCPNCKSEFFNDLKLYCMICWKRQAKYHLKVHVSKEYQNFNIACDQCSAKNLQMKEDVRTNDADQK